MPLQETTPRCREPTRATAWDLSSIIWRLVMARYSLLCPFLDDSNSYTCGFEFGQFWETMKRLKPDKVLRNLFHVDNQEQITLAANRMGWKVLKMEPVKETPGWVYIEIQK